MVVLTRFIYHINFLGQVLIILLSSVLHSVYAQLPKVFVEKSIVINSDTVLLDSLSIVPGSFNIFSKRNDSIQMVDADCYELLPISSKLILKDKSCFDSLIYVSYRRMVWNFSKIYYNKPDSVIEYYFKNQLSKPYMPSEQNRYDFFDWGDLQKNGTISRGIIVGNNQDLSVSSSFNLQLAGKLSEDIEILASVSDNNIPVQPDGNTRNLQDFDQVYIKIFNERHALTVGDYFFSGKGGYFLRYNKRLQGLNYNGTFVNAKGVKQNVETALAFSRGKFGRNIIQGQEGNQGPYRLKGEQNETFIVVLAGTEKVFVDGKLMVRGQDFDYMINYNTAEIIFTPKVLITQNTRIIVEFQYTTQNYARSLMYAGSEWEAKKSKYYLKVYSEQDVKSRPLNQELDSARKVFLSQIGDEVDKAFFSGISLDEYSSNKILYKMIDSLGYDSVLVYSTNPDSAKYKVVFSYVGAGNGNYVLADLLAAGRVYRWVAPVGGIKQGDYEPVILLYTPQKLQMATAGGQWSLFKGVKQMAEMAVSDYDPNTFSDLQSHTHTGWAINQHIIIGNQNDTGKVIKPFGGYYTEYVDRYFKPVQWYREPEFDRQWNIRGQNIQGDQWWNKIYGGVSNRFFLLRYEFNTFSASTLNAYRHVLHANYAKDKTVWKNSATFLTGRGIVNSQYLTYRINPEHNIGRLTLGFWNDVEHNQIFNATNDTLSKRSFAWTEYMPYLQIGDSSTNQFKISYKYREDFFSDYKALIKSNYSHDYAMQSAFIFNVRHQLSLQMTYRQIRIIDSLLAVSKNRDNLLFRADHRYRNKKGWIQSQLYYETGSGIEAKKEIRYIEVQPGLGTHTWIDYNKNGVKEISEFEPAIFSDQANYVKVITNSNEYVSVYYGNVNAMMFIKPEQFWSKPENLFQKTVGKLSNKFTYRSEIKSYRPEDILLPGVYGLNDTFQIQSNYSIVNSVFVNRNNSVWNAEWNKGTFYQRNFLLTGFDLRSTMFDEVRLRLNPSKEWYTSWHWKKSFKQSSSDLSAGRNYFLTIDEYDPEIVWQPNNYFRITANYSYQIKQNKQEFGGEKAQIHRPALEIRYNVATKASYQLKVQYVLINYQGTTNTPVAFDMLESLNPGQNWIVSAAWQKVINSNMQVNLIYNGRITPDNKFIQTGNLQVRAFF